MTTITVKIGAKDYTVETDCAPGTVLEVWGGWPTWGAWTALLSGRLTQSLDPR